MDFASLGIRIPEVLLPNPQVDLSLWPVVACDQYTSQPKYWEEVASLVGSAPSTLHLIYPEIYLGKEDSSERIHQIHRKMQEYQNNVLCSQGNNFILVNRRTTHALSRAGLIVALDLDCYDYHSGSQTLIRATEGTVLDRIPPRVKIREEATLELPHILVLIDDPEKQVIEPVLAQLSKLTKIYSIDLMMNGGHIDGYKVNNETIIANIFMGLSHLADKKKYNEKYGLDNQAVLLYAVGDGNHSLATAKAVWDRIKVTIPKDALENHPARYALVELVNIHDQGIDFEPIHRVLFQVVSDQLITAMENYYRKHGSGFVYQTFTTKSELENAVLTLNKQDHILQFVTENGWGVCQIHKPFHNLEVGTLQLFLDEYILQHPEIGIDYIHGEDVVTDLGIKPGNMGFYLPPMEKSALFKTVIINGVLPRKTFSMGEAEEKRFYMECRKIR